MLKKELCKKCYNQIGGKLKWSEKNEEKWRDGIVECLMTIKNENATWIYGRKHLITDEPLDHCKYFLEHTINAK